MEFRKIFDTIPDEFDRWRPRYCDAAFYDMIHAAGLDSTKAALEIGPGTGQATGPVLKTGCNYVAVELGENLAAFMRDKFSGYPNFHIINDDFGTCELGRECFDLVYSAATIQWIPENVGFPKAYSLLKHGGVFAMMFTRSDYRTPNEELYQNIQRVYAEYFHPETPYTCKLAYDNVVNYGFTALDKREYHQTRVLSADDFASYTATHCDHIALKEPYRANFFDGIRNAVRDAGGSITLLDTIVLYMTRKP